MNATTERELRTMERDSLERFAKLTRSLKRYCLGRGYDDDAAVATADLMNAEVEMARRDGRS